MRQLLWIFGILDLIIVATSIVHLPSDVRGLGIQPLLNTAWLLMLASLVASGVGLLQGKHWALVLNYVQFPVRLLLGILSFGWLAWLILPAHPSIRVNEAVWGSAVAIEGIRLGLTIAIDLLLLRPRRSWHATTVGG